MNRGSNEYLLNVTGEEGSKFRVIVRMSVSDELNFSVVLGVKVPPPKKFFRLKRYNGNHEHTNTIEDEKVIGFHIHTATERYQVNSVREEDYAEPTERYTDVTGALKCLFADANFEDSKALQDTLFEEG